MKSLYKSVLFLSMLTFFISSCKTSSSPIILQEEPSSSQDSLLSVIDSLENELKIVSSKLRKQKYEPGKIYFNCRVPPQFEENSVSYHIYTGDRPDMKGVMKQQVETSSAYVDWAPYPAEDVCDGNNAGCTFWALQEMPAQYRTLNLVSDTALVKDFEEITISVRSVVKSGDLIQGEVVCPTDCFGHNPLLLQVQQALIELGYDLTGAKEKGWGEVTKAALVDFQKKKGLPFGQLDIETLRALGIGTDQKK